MKINKILTTTILAGSLVSSAIVGCQEGELYDVESPEWLSDSINAVAARRANSGSSFDAESVVSDGWWSAWSKNYDFPENKRMTIEITLDKSTREELWKNWVMVLSTTDWTTRNDASTGYGEYFVVRGDGGNWNGTGTVSVTTTDAMPLADAAYKDFEQDGTEYVIVAEHYPTGGILINCSQKNPSGEEYHWTATGTAEAGKGIWVFFAGEGSTFTITNITYETLEELTPAKLEVTGTPKAVSFTEEKVEPSYYYGDGEATVTWSNGTTSKIAAKELTFSVVPDLKTVGTAVVTVAYGKTSMGQFCEPVSTGYKIEVVGDLTGIKINPTSDEPTYYYAPGTTGIKKEDIDVTAFIKSVVGVSGTAELPLSDYTTDVTIPATFGNDIVITVKYKDFTATLNVKVAEMKSKEVSLFGEVIGDETYSNEFCSALTKSTKIAAGSGAKFSFVNKSAGTDNYKNFIIILSNSEAMGMWNDNCYGVMRADWAAWGHQNATTAGWNWECGLFETWTAEANWVWDGDDTHSKMSMAISDSKVTVEIINKGATVDVKCTIVSNIDNQTYFQNYLNIPVSGDVYAAFSSEAANLLFE
ncbi:MAG: hypothetical protein II937_14015 [Bacteroidales bacterium]|nr:hypothetical protein [Bacteroidales bacterium]